MSSGNFVSCWSSVYFSMTHPNKYRSYSSLSLKRGHQFRTSGYGRGGVDDRTTHFCSQKFNLSTDTNYVFFCHVSVIAQHPPRRHYGVLITHLMLVLVINFTLLMVMVKLVWVLGPPIFLPRNMIVGLMVMILCHLRVGIIHP